MSNTPTVEQISTAIAVALAPLLSMQVESDSKNGIPIYLIPNKNFWVPIEEAHKFLGGGWSKHSILKRIEQGELEEGKLWRDERSLSSRLALKKINVYAVDRWLSNR